MTHSRANVLAQGSKKVVASALLGMAMMAATSLLAAQPAHAADFTVTNTNDSGAGSLRQAIEQANSASGADTIRFSIAGSGVQTISPNSPLPFITDPLTIDG